MTDSGIARNSVRLLSTVLVALMVLSPIAASLGFAPVGTAAANTGIHYVTDSGFEIEDTSGGATPTGNPFSDSDTLNLPGITLSASGDSYVTLEQRNGTFTNLSSVDDDPTVTVTPDDKQEVALMGEFDSLNFSDANYTTANTSVDIEYSATSDATLRLESTGLSQGEPVNAVDTDSDTTLDSTTVASNGSVTFTSLSSGDHVVDLTSEAPSISSFSASNPSSQNVRISFDSDKQLSTIDVTISNAESATLTEGDFSETDNGGSYTYQATYAGSSDGTYDVSLDTAKDAIGNDGASSESDSVDISTGGGGGGGGGGTSDDSDDDGDDGDDGQYSSAPEGSTVVTGEKTDSDDTSEPGDTVGFEVSLSSDEGDSDSNTVVLDIVGSDRNDEDGDTPEESTTPEDDDTPADSDTADEDSDQNSAGGEKNVAVDSMVIGTTDDAASEFSITVREWSVNTTATPGADAGNPQNSLAVADAADSIDPSANTLASGSNTDSMTTGQTSDRTDPRQFLEETSASAVGYVEVNHTNPDSEIENVTFQFRVRKSYLNGSAVGPDSVALYRDETAGWNELDAEQVSENETFYFFEATSPGLSLFTIGSTQPVIETQRVETSTTMIAEGESTTVEATVTNLGPVDGNHTVSLTADGEQVASQSVAVAGNETESVTLTFTPDTAGEYDLAIDGQDAGVLSVQAPTGASTESADSTGGSVLVGLLIVVVVAGLLVVYVRRHDDDAGGPD